MEGITESDSCGSAGFTVLAFCFCPSITEILMGMLNEVVLKIDCQEWYIELLLQSSIKLLPLLWSLAHLPLPALENSFASRRCILLEDEHFPDICNQVTQMPGNVG
jgi:hypothetical protein